jgi:ABC-2 type transport system permease protein
MSRADAAGRAGGLAPGPGPASTAPGAAPAGTAPQTATAGAAPAGAAPPLDGARSAPDAGWRGSAGVVGAAVWPWWRLLKSELRLVFRQWRHLALLAVLAALPVLLGIALRLSAPHGGAGGPNSFFFGQVAGNGVFLAFIALTLMLVLALPLAVAVVSGDSVAGEAGSGTLRYLLAVPAGRARLLSVKYVAVMVYALAACVVAAGVSLIVGVALFPVGPVTLLSGTTVPLTEGLVRLLLVTLYVAAGLAALGAIGLAVSTFTEHPIGAIAATMIITVASEVTDQVPQFAAVHPYLLTHWWLSFDALLRSPVATGDLMHGLLSFGMYVLVFCSIAWARFTSADVTS